VKLLALAALLTGLAAPSVGVGSDATRPSVIAVRQQQACGRIELRGTVARGGCELALVRGRVRLTVLTMFGDEEVGVCPFRFRMRLGAAGEVAMDRVAVSAFPFPSPHRRDGACGDAFACQQAGKAPKEHVPGVPWSGDIDPAGKTDEQLITIQVCLDTCFGRFEGPSRWLLRPLKHGGWLLRASNASVGMSGLELAGVWRLRRPS
jgi:hypothetical protein